MSNIVYKNFTFSTPFLRGYRELKIPIMNSDGTPAWPELFPTARINELRVSVGPRHFSAQMMLEFMPIDRARLDPDALHLYDDEFNDVYARVGDADITGACVYWDPSSGRRRRDGSVCILIYRDDKTRRVFIHDVLYLIVDEDDLHPLAHQCEVVLDFMRRHGMRRITIETNGIGNALPEIMRDVSNRRHAGISICGVTNSRNKEIRILDAIEPVLGAGRLYAHRRVVQTPLLSEMLGWTPACGGPASHDDGLDALAGAISVAPTPIHPMGRLTKIHTANTNFKI